MDRGLSTISGEILLWHNLDELRALIDSLDRLFRDFAENFSETTELAQKIRDLIIEIDPFIETYSKRVCSVCRNICCLNKNSRYEYYDLIYILALRESFPVPKRNLKEGEPCYLLTERGCMIPRYLRPLRCNWYVCKELLRAMESAPARMYRNFSQRFSDMLELRQQMLSSFFRSLSQIESYI